MGPNRCLLIESSHSFSVTVQGMKIVNQVKLTSCHAKMKFSMPLILTLLCHAQLLNGYVQPIPNVPQLWSTIIGFAKLCSEAKNVPTDAKIALTFCKDKRPLINWKRAIAKVMKNLIVLVSRLIWKNSVSNMITQLMTVTNPLETSA